MGAGTRGSGKVVAEGDRAGYSIRVNHQWRTCFRWKDADAYDVEVVDCH